MFIECNLFMVIAREEKAQELLCAGMLKSERSWSKVLITEMRRDVIEMAKIWTFFFCPRVSKMSVISGAAVETFLITRFERICSSEASVDATVRQQDAVPYLQNHFPGSSLLQLCCIH